MKKSRIVINKINIKMPFPNFFFKIVPPYAASIARSICVKSMNLAGTRKKLSGGREENTYKGEDFPRAKRIVIGTMRPKMLKAFLGLLIRR